MDLPCCTPSGVSVAAFNFRNARSRAATSRPCSPSIPPPASTNASARVSASNSDSVKVTVYRFAISTSLGRAPHPSPDAVRLLQPDGGQIGPTGQPFADRVPVPRGPGGPRGIRLYRHPFRVDGVDQHLKGQLVD